MPRLLNNILKWSIEVGSRKELKCFIFSRKGYIPVNAFLIIEGVVTMAGPENELFGMLQPNPNEFGKCSTCGKLLQTKQEAKVKTCKECQRRGRDDDMEVHEGE